MKKIYTITLDDDIPLSESISSDIKEIAYFLFEEIAKYDRQILVVDDDRNLIRNELLESYHNGRYNFRFDSEHTDIDNYRYEPFLINDRSFGFTVYDGSIDEEEIQSLLNNVLIFFRLNYKFNIDCLYYDDEFINNRQSAYNFVTFGNRERKKEDIKVKKKTRLLPSPLLTMFNL